MGTFANAATANDYMTGRKPLRTPQGAEVVAARFTISLGTADLDASYKPSTKAHYEARVAKAEADS